MSKTILAGALVASVLLALPLVATADSGHGDSAESASEGGNSGAHGSHGGSTPRPAGLAGAWAALMGARDAIAADVESGALGDVHAKAEPLPDLVVALLQESGDLDASKRRRVDGAAKQVTRVATALHVAADRADAAKTRKELSRLDGLLELIHAQYPAGTLDAGTHGDEGHSAVPGHAHGAHAHMDQPAGVVAALPQATIRVRALDQLHQLDEPGTYPVLCTIPGHTEAGMVGELVVLAGHGPAHPHP